MLNITLFVKEIKSNYKLFLIFAAVLTMYPAVIITMFDPNLGESLNLMMASMPDLFAAFGMENPGTTLIEFLVNYLYGFLLVIFPMVFLIILSNKLVARYVDQGSMVYLIATPNKRNRIVLNQAFFLLTCIFLQVVYITGICIFLSAALFPGELDIRNFILINVGLLGLHVFLGGLCFLSSCLCNDVRISNGISAGFCISFAMLQMLSQVGEKFSFLKYATPLTLFQPLEILAGSTKSFVFVGLLYGGGILMASIGAGAFTKRNLSL